MLRMAAEQQKPATIQRVLNPRATCQPDEQHPCRHLEPLKDDELRVWLDPLFEAEDFFLTRPAGQEKAYHATAMQLTLENDTGSQKEVRAVVDARAAHQRPGLPIIPRRPSPTIADAGAEPDSGHHPARTRQL